MRVFHNGNFQDIKLVKFLRQFHKNPRFICASASGVKLWGFRGETPNAKKPPIKGSFCNRICNRCRLSLQALPTKQR